MSLAHIRAAVPADLNAIAAIAAESPTAPQWSVADFRAILAESTNEPLARMVLVIADDEGVAGFAVYTLLKTVFPPDAELESLAVAASHRRRGLGVKLFDAVQQASQAAGAEHLMLEVRAGNVPALALYRGAGCLTAGIRKGYYASPVEDAVLMQLPFPAENR